MNWKTDKMLSVSLIELDFCTVAQVCGDLLVSKGVILFYF